MDVLVGYGRRPWLALIYSVVVISIGCVVFFRRSGMDPQEPEHKSQIYNPFWYSLDLFLPFIDLQIDSEWIPKQDRWFARNYRYVHTFLGWILIPIGLAALTGIIK